MSKRSSNGSPFLYILGICLFAFIIYKIIHSKILLIILGSILAAFLISYLIYKIVVYKKNKKRIQDYALNHNDSSNVCISKNEDKENKEYEVKIKFVPKASLMSDYEKEIFKNINIAVSELPDLIVLPQVNLASIITKVKENAWEYQNELYRNIDFGIFTKDYEPKIMIELNDKTHAAANRYERDLKVRNILSEARIPLITLYSSYPNKPEYIKQRILEALSEKISA